MSKVSNRLDLKKRTVYYHPNSINPSTQERRNKYKLLVILVNKLDIYGFIVATTKRYKRGVPESLTIMPSDFEEIEPAYSGKLVESYYCWDNVKDTLQKMQDSFDFVDSSIIRKNTLLPIVEPTENRRAPFTVQSSAYHKGLITESNEKWVEGMRGYETLSSPSTGQTYQVPINSWSLYGPEGSGYYRLLEDGKFEKLQ